MVHFHPTRIDGHIGSIAIVFPEPLTNILRRARQPSGHRDIAHIVADPTLIAAVKVDVVKQQVRNPDDRVAR